MILEKVKGIKDFGPEDKIRRQSIIGTIKTVFEKYGFSPIETSVLERFETLTAKYAGGAEIIREIYKLKDQGGRKLGLRYDLTVPLAQFIGMNPTMKMPFKKYEVGRVFRDGPVKLGRLREFWQCDVDIVGTKSMIAEAEILTLAKEVLDKLNIKTVIKINNRKILNGIISFAGIKKNKEEAILCIDKLDKSSINAVKKELGEKGFSLKDINKVLDIIKIKGTNKEILNELKTKMKNEEGSEGIEEIEELLSYLKKFNTKVQLDISLVRGLSYYTGTVYEIFMKNGNMTSSLAAGGRWDKLISKFLKTEKEYPAVGITLGLEPINEIISEKEKDIKKSVTQVYVIPIGTTNESLALVKKLRKKGIKTDMDLIGRGVSKNLDYANSLKIPFVLLIGKKELKQKKVKLKNMESGNEKLISLKEAIKIISKTP